MIDKVEKIKFSAFPKEKRRVRSDPNSVCYFLDLVNRIDSLQLAVAQERAETQRLREQVRAFLQRGHL